MVRHQGPGHRHHDGRPAGHHPLFAAPGTTYSTRADQGLEFDDSATKWIDQTGVDFSLNSWNVSDAVRIITVAP
jgi:hypothetical protein